MWGKRSPANGYGTIDSGDSKQTLWRLGSCGRGTTETPGRKTREEKHCHMRFVCNTARQVYDSTSWRV